MARLGCVLCLVFAVQLGTAYAEPVVIDCGNRALLMAQPPGPPVIQTGSVGGLDAGYPGDAAELLISSGSAGKRYYGTPDAASVTVRTTGVPLTVAIQYRAYKYGTSRLEVMWDDSALQVLDCRSASEAGEMRAVEFRLTDQQAAAGRHLLTLAERGGTDGNYATVDAIAFDGDPGLVVITNSGRALRPAASPRRPAATSDTTKRPLRLAESAALLRADFSANDSTDLARGWQVTGSDGGTACLWDGALYVPTPPRLVHSLSSPVRGTSGTFALRQDVPFPAAGTLLAELKAYPERDTAAILAMCERSQGPEKLYLARFKGQIALSDGKAVWNLLPADDQFHLIRIDFAEGIARVCADGELAKTDVPWPDFDRVSIGHAQPYDGYGIGVAVRSLFLTDAATTPVRVRVFSGAQPRRNLPLAMKTDQSECELVTDDRGEASIPVPPEGGLLRVVVREATGERSIGFTAVPGDTWVWDTAVQTPGRTTAPAGPHSSAPTQVWLDLGGRGTPVGTGFAPLTEGTEAATSPGAGWLPGTRLVPAGMPGSDDALIGDYLDVEQPGQTASLQLELAPGDYSVTLLCVSPDLPLDFIVRCDGQPVAWVTQPRTGSWGVYSFPVRLDRRTPRFDFDVASSLGLAAMVVAPLDPKRPEVRRLAVFRDGLRDALSAAMAEAQGMTADNPPPDPEPALDAQAQARGYALFAHSYMRPVYDGSRPRAEDLAVPVSGFGCAGEFEPLAVSVWPLRNLTSARVTVTALRRDGSTDLIPATAIDVKAVRIWPQRSGPNRYRRVPELIEDIPEEGLSLPAHKTRTFWLTLRVPDGQAPGDYRGQVTFSCDGSAASLPVWFKVLPLEREPIGDLAMGMYWSWTMSAGSDLALARRQFGDMRRHGCTTICLEAPAPLRKVGERWTVDVELLDKLLALYREVGFSQPVPVFGNGWPGNPEAWEAGTRLLLAEEQKRGWPELLFYPVDEPGNSPEALAEAIRLCQAVKRVPGARTYITTNGQGKDAAALDPWLDVRTYQHLSYNPEEARRTLAAGDALWFYTGPPSGFVYPRLNDGLWWFRSQMTGHFWWHYCWPVGDPWCDLDGAGDYCATYPGPKGPVATVQWECLREGLEDLRYLRTLRAATTRARATGKGGAMADEAEAYLTALCDRIPADGKEIATALQAIRAEEFQTIRWEVVKRTLALQDATDGGQRARLVQDTEFARTLPRAPYRGE